MSDNGFTLNQFLCCQGIIGGFIWIFSDIKSFLYSIGFVVGVLLVAIVGHFLLEVRRIFILRRAQIKWLKTNKIGSMLFHRTLKNQLLLVGVEEKHKTLIFKQPELEFELSLWDSSSQKLQTVFLSDAIERYDVINSRFFG